MTKNLNFNKLFIIVLAVFLGTGTISASGHEESHSESKDYDAVGPIMEHIVDSHEWHLWTTKDDQGEEHHVSVPLPIILVDGGLKVFMSSQFEHDHHDHKKYTAKVGDDYYVMYDQKIYKSDANFTVNRDSEGKITNEIPWDFSITKNVFALLVSVLLLLFIMFRVKKFYVNNPNKAPKGIASLLEPVIFVVRDIAKTNIHKKHSARFMPLLLTLFFFIWLNNLLGLIPIIPGGANLTGNIAVTMVLSVIVLVVILLNGNKHYWQHIFWMPGAPVPVKLLLAPIEVVGIFTKPFALMVRLFANITAGHIVVLSLVSLVFIFKNVALGAVSVPFALFISILELLVAFLQAYVFTMLTALFIGGAVDEAHH